MTASALSQDIWTPTERQLNNMVRIIHDLERVREIADTLTNRLAKCEYLVDELIIEREECAALVETCEEVTNHLRKRNAVLTDRLDRSEVKRKRSRWLWGILGFVAGNVTGYVVAKTVK
jgi:hypothetical protein